MRRRLGGAIAAFAALISFAAPAQTLRATYAISLLGLPIGAGFVKAVITPTSYAIDGRAKLNALASLVSSSRGASIGHGAIVERRISPTTFATTAANARSTRTIRMALKGNAVVAVDISPPFAEYPDRVPLRPQDTHDIIDPVGAFVFLAPPIGPAVSPAACDRTLPIFDGYTRFDLKLSYAGERRVKAKGYSGPVAMCNVRYAPIAGHRKDRPATKYMEENRGLQIWLAPVEGTGALVPFRVSIKTMVGVLAIEATDFSVSK
ncbi:MAG TPA: DUF3108 domain-containing protein [Roseiarcus sp.]|nr:DUF3108 domain-containing protein [Roseiarcus sp.]